MRLWPDNYLFKQRLEGLLEQYDASKPLILGRVANFDSKHSFVGGGAGWVISRAGLQAWVAQDGTDLTRCRPPAWVPETHAYAEDVIISHCLARAGISFIQKKEVFLSFPPGDEHNANNLTEDNVASGMPTPVVTTHYMTTSNMVNLWRKEKRRRRFAILSVAATSKLDDYSFILPFTVASWKRISWSSIIVVVGVKTNLHHFAQTAARTILDIDPRVFIEYVESAEAEKTTVAQVARLFVATLSWLDARDILITSDADLLPISSSLYDQASSQEDSVVVLNGDCCGVINVRNKEIKMQPMSHICGTKQSWLSVMNIREEPQLTTSSIKSWLYDKNLGEILPTPVKKIYTTSRSLNSFLTW